MVCSIPFSIFDRRNKYVGDLLDSRQLRVQRRVIGGESATHARQRTLG